MSALVDRISETVDKLRNDPTAGVANPSVTASLANGHARLSSGPFNWDCDLGPAIGGENLAPSPTAYLLGALAGCGVVFLRDTLAPQFGVTLTDVEATASGRADTAGLLGINGASPALQDIALTIRVTSPDPAERLEPMLAAWRERCPIYLALINPNQVTVEFLTEAAPRT
jgi:uncharacterized OsmC-like protein